MAITDELLVDAKDRMAKSVESSRGELATVRTGRASPHLLDRIVVDYYGSQTPLKQLANVSASDARLLTVQPFDKSAIGAIEKSILESDVGLSPSNDGAVIRLNIPALNEERRKDLVKQLHKKVEEGRVELRTLRRHAHDEMRAKEKSAGITTDEVKRAEAQLQKLTDRYILMADEIGQAKEKEILSV